MCEALEANNYRLLGRMFLTYPRTGHMACREQIDPGATRSIHRSDLSCASWQVHTMRRWEARKYSGNQ